MTNSTPTVRSGSSANSRSTKMPGVRCPNCYAKGQEIGNVTKGHGERDQGRSVPPTERGRWTFTVQAYKDILVSTVKQSRCARKYPTPIRFASSFA
ncbi:Uncharacterized protein PECH_007522 [Penicillium ucsense]|uniref:Uncharacterized protein n=1 Tax=Penicillium ucsense TaxID=2839758 RepID=A0A8J8WKU4_9EURO|nr:Uncharacterized protein PECM_004418 [Penicillium ucsense]KAF7738821.1 Uncharacterized protein PECH_007522 [Penicillium ucsense]